MHWTLETVRGLSVDDYDEIVAWLNDEAARASGEPSIDMDALIRQTRGTKDDDGG